MDASRLGANYRGDGRCAFTVWAPKAKRLRILLHDGRKHELLSTHNGYHQAMLDQVFPGTRYWLQLDANPPRPDPASHFQPDGVHGPSMVVDPKFPWQDSGWGGLTLDDYILYELHVGTFTPEGTFEAIIPHLDSLLELGVTAIELMPVTQFPGSRNWGYDGVFPFAVQNSYGGPMGLKGLIDAAHQRGLAVVLDVMYNHLGPEGNFLREFGPYFTSAYKTPWGEAVNFDGPFSDEVRRFFLENALYWQEEFHVDGLRLDAVHAIRDFSAIPFLQDLARQTHATAQRLHRPCCLFAESDLNDARMIRPEELGGLGMDAQWADDFHHALHVLLTGERHTYYQDFARPLPLLAEAFRHGYAYTGQYSAFRRHRHGSPTAGTRARQFVVCSQNHDQVGNRPMGDRLSQGTSWEALKLAAGSVLLSPFVPLLFMGEEYGELAPFYYFVNHSDPALVQAVREGRRQEFAFAEGPPIPDPDDLSTFQQCILNHDLCKTDPRHRALRKFYRELILCRKSIPAISRAEKDQLRTQVLESEESILVHYPSETNAAALVLCFSGKPQKVALPPGKWQKRLDSAEDCWLGPGSRVPGSLEGESPVMVQGKSVLLFTQR